MNFFLIFFLCFFCSCVSPFAALNRFRDRETILEELRTEIADLKHAVHATEVEIHLLEENLENQTDSKVGQLAEVVDDISRKVATLDKNQERAAADLKNLVTHANQTTHSLSQYRDRIKELDRKLERAQPIHKKIGETIPQNYRVQSGDSLQKIARVYHTSVENLKHLNGLKGDTIFVGQLLQVTDTPSYEE